MYCILPDLFRWLELRATLVHWEEARDGRRRVLCARTSQSLDFRAHRPLASWISFGRRSAAGCWPITSRKERGPFSQQRASPVCKSHQRCLRQMGDDAVARENHLIHCKLQYLSELLVCSIAHSGRISSARNGERLECNRSLHLLLCERTVAAYRSRPRVAGSIDRRQIGFGKILLQ